MVNKEHIEENTACIISQKNNLRRESCDLIAADNKMGSTHGHLLNEVNANQAKVEEVLIALKGKNDGKSVRRYDKETILALRDDPQSKEKPKCADERSFWINGKPFNRTSSLRHKKIDRETRFGSGRLNPGEKYIPPTNSSHHYPPQYNPVNHDHRRLFQKSEENLPEWVNAGPRSRYETIDLHGFHDDKKYTSESETGSKNLENKENNKDHHKKKTFTFDEFLESQGNGALYPGQESYSSYNNRPQGPPSQYKRYFNNNKNRDYHFLQGQQQPQQPKAPPGFVGQQRNFPPKFDANNNDAAAALLDLLHRHSFDDQYNKQPNFSFASTNKNNVMLTAADLEAVRCHNNRTAIERQRQMEHNKAMLAGKSIVDVLDVLTKSQMRANAAPFNNNQSYPPQWNPQQQQQFNQNNRNNMSGQPIPPNTMKSNNHMNKFQMARVLERQMKYQGQNPMYGGLTPQDPEYWEKIRQQQELFYQQYERNASNRQVKVKFPGGERRVKFEEKSTLEQFFNNHQNIGDLPTFDPEKAIKVEEFERKIKGAAAFKQFN